VEATRARHGRVFARAGTDRSILTAPKILMNTRGLPAALQSRGDAA
jgi:hypothetical protein